MADSGEIPVSEGLRRPVFDNSTSLTVLLAVFGVVGLLVLLATVSPPIHEDGERGSERAYGPGDFPEVFAQNPLEGLENAHGNVAVAPPPLHEFPCSDCHEGDTDNPRRTEVEDHGIVLHHDEEHRWCLDCHDAANRDFLHLADGTQVPFEESYRLCGQCHGTRLRDWQAGAHGRRTGYWDGPKRYLLCVNCHDPHNPRFQPLVPLPPPVEPRYVRDGRGEEAPGEGGAR